MTGLEDMLRILQHYPFLVVALVFAGLTSIGLRQASGWLRIPTVLVVYWTLSVFAIWIPDGADSDGSLFQMGLSFALLAFPSGVVLGLLLIGLEAFRPPGKP